MGSNKREEKSRLDEIKMGGIRGRVKIREESQIKVTKGDII